jgi:hypothetical protein
VPLSTKPTIASPSVHRLGVTLLLIGWIVAEPACRASSVSSQSRPTASAADAPSASQAVPETAPALSSLPPERLGALDRASIESRLKDAGFRVTDATETTSGGFHHVRVTAERDTKRVVVELYQPGDPYWKARLKRKHAVVLSQNGVLLGVIAKGDVKLARSVAVTVVHD